MPCKADASSKKIKYFAEVDTDNDNDADFRDLDDRMEAQTVCQPRFFRASSLSSDDSPYD